MTRKRKIDWTPTMGIAIAGLTAYLIYTSLRLDREIQHGHESRAAQKEKDAQAAQDRINISAKSDKRNKQLTAAIAFVGVIVAITQIKGFPWI